MLENDAGGLPKAYRNAVESLGMLLECIGIPCDILEYLGMSHIDLEWFGMSRSVLECLGMS